MSVPFLTVSRVDIHIDFLLSSSGLQCYILTCGLEKPAARIELQYVEKMGNW